MRTKNHLQTSPQTQEEVFREKTRHYLVCFIDHCPLRERCLRWLVGQHVDSAPLAWNAVSPRHPKTGSEDCEMFRENVRMVMKRGMTRLYDDMPQRIAFRIRHTLIAWWGRKRYFEMRRGDRLLTPELQQDVVSACRQHGWQGPVVYDGEQTDWLW